MAKVLPPQNRILRDFLQSGVDIEQPRSSYIAKLHEFDDCRYKLERCAAVKKSTLLLLLWCDSASKATTGLPTFDYCSAKSHGINAWPALDLQCLH